jgi:hypothetical protein
MLKKILKISAITFFVIALGIVYYYFFFAKNTTSSANTAGNTPSSTNFFPFGQGGTSASGNQNQFATSSITNQPQAGNYLEKLRLISNDPVAGATFVEAPAGVYIRYIEKATGHVFDVATFSSDAHEVSNTTIPQLHDAFFTEKANSFVAQYVLDDTETIATLYGKIASTTTGTQLASGMDSLAVSPSGANIFYIQKSASGSTGILSAPNGINKKQIWDSKIRSILPQFAGENSIIMTTKPNAQLAGYAYLVNAKTGSVKTILQNISDLSTLANQTGTTLLYYTSDNGGGMFSYSLTNGTTTAITPVTFPEKCVFDTNNKNIFYCAVSNGGLSATALDDWYLGTVSFADDIWKYDMSKNTATILENLTLNAGRNIDAINLQLNSSGSLLIFQSKTDGSLWGLNVGQ